jgi:nitric oxide reductase large subunit
MIDFIFENFRALLVWSKKKYLCMWIAEEWVCSSIYILPSEKEEIRPERERERWYIYIFLSLSRVCAFRLPLILCTVQAILELIALSLEG